MKLKWFIPNDRRKLTDTSVFMSETHTIFNTKNKWNKYAKSKSFFRCRSMSWLLCDTFIYVYAYLLVILSYLKLKSHFKCGLARFILSWCCSLLFFVRFECSICRFVGYVLHCLCNVNTERSKKVKIG